MIRLRRPGREGERQAGVEQLRQETDRHFGPTEAALNKILID